jgi:hypothetical protein
MSEYHEFTSIRFRIEEFLASSEVFFSIIRLKKIIDSNGVFDDIQSSLTVQPVPAPFSTKELTSNNIKDGGNNQKETLFNRGNAISGAPHCTGKR